MENLGYKEGSTKPKPKMPRRMSRAASVIPDNEAIPLSMSMRHESCVNLF